MKILSNVTMAGNVSLASNAKDQFTIGSELERDNANADELKVWANANFYNDVTIGSSSADVFTVNAGTFNLSGTALVNNTTTNLYVSKQGSDSNSGLAADSGSALLTIQAAVDKLATLNATTNNRELFHVTINIASGSYEEKVNLVNKGIGKSDSNLLVKFVGTREIIHSAVPATGAITTDPDLSFDNSVQCGLVLNFTGSIPEQDTLKGYFLISSDNYRTAVINHHSGNNFYADSIGFGFNDIPQTVSIVRPAVEVKGLFRTAGINGAIAFDTIRITGLDDGEDCYPFGGFMAPPTNLEYTSLDKYRSVSKDEILAYNCQIMVTGTVDVIMPANFQFINGYIFGGNSNNLTLTNYAQADELKIMGSLVENVLFRLDGYRNLDFRASTFEDNTGAIYKTPTCIGPKKLKYTSVGNFIVLSETNVSFLANYICKSGYMITYGGAVTYFPSSYFVGPFNRIIDAYGTSVDFYYGGDGPPTGSHFFSGSLEADRFFILNQDSYLKVQGQIDLSNVNISGAYPPLYVNNSKVVFTHVLPITASITSSNYVPYDIQLDDSAQYKYTDLPIVNQQGSLLDNRAIYYDIRTDTKIPFTAEDVTIIDSITSNNGYKINGNLAVGEAEYNLSGYGYGAGSYQSGTVIRDAFGVSGAEIIVGKLSSSAYNRNHNIIDLFNQSAGISVWSDGIDFYSPDGFISLQEIISAVQGGGGGGGSYADSVIQQATQSYEQYGGGSGSYFSGTVFYDGQNQAQNASISIGHTSASNYNINSDIIELSVNQSRVRVTETGIDFNFGTSSLSIDQIYSTVYGGGGSAITNLQSTGSGESLVRDVNNGTGYLRRLKSTSTISVIQQTNELELTVNPNLTLTSLTSQGTLVVSGNVQLGDQSSDTTTVTGQLTASSGIQVGGSIIPNASASYSLGSVDKPFKEIYVSSGSLSIASPYANVAATTVSNNSGNLDISAGGVRLVGTGSFIGNGSQLTNVLATNVKHSYQTLTANYSSASFDYAITYLDDGSPASFGLPDIDGKDGYILILKNLQNTQATIHAYTGQTINGVATHQIAGKAAEMFHATSGSGGLAWYTLISTLALYLVDAWGFFGLI